MEMFKVESFVSTLMLLIEHGLFFDVNLERRLLFFGDADEVADFAFDADIGHEPLPSFGVETRQVAGIGIAIRVAVGYVEQVHKVVAVIHEIESFNAVVMWENRGLSRRDGYSTVATVSDSVDFSFLVKMSARWW